MPEFLGTYGTDDDRGFSRLSYAAHVDYISTIFEGFAGGLRMSN